MPSLELHLGINETHYVGDIKVTTESPEEKKKVIPGSVALHEAKHAVAAIVNGTGVRSATIIPGTGYLGLTELTRPDAVAAAAPHATGSSGTSHDMTMVHLMGHDATAAASAARGIIRSNQDKVEAVASMLEERGTATGYEIEEEMRSSNNKTKKVTVIVEDLAEGSRKTEMATASEGVVVFRSEWVDRGA